jgi:hypothetical protein
MSTVIYPPTSPFSATPQSSWAIGLLVFRAVSPDGGDTLYTLLPQHQYRPDRLSYDLYTTPSFWWVFCERNPFLRYDPVWGFLAGLQIMVPEHSYLRRVLGA